MPSVYLHVTQDDVFDKVAEIKGIEVDKGSKEIIKIMSKKICPRCNTDNAFDAKYCSKCSMIIDQKAALELEIENKARNDEINKLKQAMESKYQDLESRLRELKKFQNEDQESRRKNRLINQILSFKYSSEIPKNIDTSEWFKEHEKLMETDLNYKKDYELCEKLESIEGFTESEEFQRALENGDKESKERKKELANIIHKLTLKDS